MFLPPIRVAASIALCVLFTDFAFGQSKTQSVSFATSPSPLLKRSVTVSSKLILPEAADKIPAVLILHSRAGIDGTGVFYAEALNAAGIATLEIEMFRSASQMARDSRENLPRSLLR